MHCTCSRIRRRAQVPKAGDPNVLYFGPGVHRPGKIELKSGETVYIAGGAVVYTAIGGRGVSGVRILGRGIIDTSEFASAARAAAPSTWRTAPT